GREGREDQALSAWKDLRPAKAQLAGLDGHTDHGFSSRRRNLQEAIAGAEPDQIVVSPGDPVGGPALGHDQRSSAGDPDALDLSSRLACDPAAVGRKNPPGASVR